MNPHFFPVVNRVYSFLCQQRAIRKEYHTKRMTAVHKNAETQLIDFDEAGSCI